MSWRGLGYESSYLMHRELSNTLQKHKKPIKRDGKYKYDPFNYDQKAVIRDIIDPYIIAWSKKKYTNDQIAGKVAPMLRDVEFETFGTSGDLDYYRKEIHDFLENEGAMALTSESYKTLTAKRRSEKANAEKYKRSF